MRAERTRGLIALLLILSAALFAVGTTIERNHHAEGGHTEVAAAPSEAPAEGGAEGSTSEGSAPAEPTAAEGDASESVLGVNLESPWLIAIAVVVSVALAIALLRTNSRWVTIAVVVAGGLFSLLDLREIAHQASASNGGLVAISAVLAAMHLAIAALGISLLRSRDPVETVAV